MTNVTLNNEFVFDRVENIVEKSFTKIFSFQQYFQKAFSSVAL